MLSGAVIALVAMVIDRITIGFAQQGGHRGAPAGLRGRNFAFSLLAALVIAALIAAIGSAGPCCRIEPDQCGGLDHGVLALVALADPVETFKNAILVFHAAAAHRHVGAVTPYPENCRAPPVTGGYAIIILIPSRGCWPIALAGGRPGGRCGGDFLRGFAAAPPGRAARLAHGGLADRPLRLPRHAFHAGERIWVPFMQSTYLVGLAVLCLLMAGLWRPCDRSRRSCGVNDTLQTMPQFVFLILPHVLQGRQFTASSPSCSMPSCRVRYVEHGSRVRPDVVEAARQVGCTPGQLLCRSSTWPCRW
jgi:glycine betaine/proline transport system permease protein